MQRRNERVEMERQGGNMDSRSTSTQREREEEKDGVDEITDGEVVAAATRMA